MNKISVFGATGAIGQRFCELYPNDIVQMNRYDYVPSTNNILYLIGTRDNFNIYEDVHIDVDTNLSILMNVLDYVEHHNNTTFNFVSTRFVYGSSLATPFHEYDSCNPEGFYSITKRCAEQMLICFCNTFGIQYRIFRLTNVLNEKDTNISTQRNALQFMIREIVNGRDIQLHYKGEARRDFIYIDDACSAIKFCMDNSPPNQIINVSDGIPHRFLDIINKTIELSGSKSKIIHVDPVGLIKTKDAWLSISKLLSYGFQFKFDTHSTLKRLVDFYKNE